MKTKNIKNKEDLKTVFEESLRCKDKILRVALTDKPILYSLDKVFIDEYMESRKKANILLRSLRFSDEEVDEPKHKEYKSYFKEVRIGPKDFLPKNSKMIWDNNILIFNTEKSSGKIIRDKKYATLMKKWFDKIWEISL